ncbi:MAG: response regulator [Chitinivibrionales bacterium]
MKVYIVEDHDSMRLILRRLLKKNFPVVTDIRESETAEKAMEEIPSFSPNLVLVDISLPGIDGIEMIRRLKPQCHGMYILVVTGHEVSMYRQSALDAGADEIVSKYDDEQLIGYIQHFLDKGKLEYRDKK